MMFVLICLHMAIKYQPHPRNISYLKQDWTQICTFDSQFDVFNVYRELSWNKGLFWGRYELSDVPIMDFRRITAQWDYGETEKYITGSG